MAKNIDNLWSNVAAVLPNAKGVYFDDCHKIYIALDDTENADFIKGEWTTGPITEQTLRDWYKKSCFLKFVSSVYTHPSDPNEGYTQLIPQGADEENEPESWDRDEED